MSKLDGRVNKLERTDLLRDVQREEMSEQDRSIIQQLSMVELSVCPDLELVSGADTDPQTFKEIQQTLAEARGEFEPEPLRQGQPKPRPNAPAKRRSGRHRDEDQDSMMEALAFIDQTIAESSDAIARMGRAVEVARTRLGQAPRPEQ